MAVFCAGASYADSVIGQFTIDSNNNTVASEGQVIFTRNTDGTIAASLTDFLTAGILGFGYNVVGIYPFTQSSYSLTQSYYPDSTWAEPFGLQGDGFYCSACGSPESWTIGTAGQFTSVWQALGGTTSTVDFVLVENSPDGNSNAWGAMAQSYSPTVTPESGSVALLGVGMLAFGTIILLRKQPAWSPEIEPDPPSTHSRQPRRGACQRPR